MNDDAVRVNRIEFRAAMPSLRLLDAVPLAFSVQCLLPAILGLGLLHGADAMIGGPSDLKANLPGLVSVPVKLAVPRPLVQMVSDAYAIVAGGFSAGFPPFTRLPVYALLLGLTGVAVSRAAGLKFCADRRNGAIRSVRHAVRSLRAICLDVFLTALICACATGVFWLSLKLTTLALWINLHQSLAGLPAWLGALILIGTTGVCGAGWLLSLSAMGVDSCDGAESLSRGISYVLSRFRRAFVYAGLTLVMTGCLAEAAWFVMTQAGRLVDQSLISHLPADARPGVIDVNQFVVEAWKLSVFFCSITICYVLLRKVEDGVTVNETDGCHSRAGN